MENPCRSCENVDGDKNRPECKDCTKRVQYIAHLGGNAYDARPAKTNIECKGEILMTKDFAAIPKPIKAVPEAMVIDMSRIPGADEILEKIREIGKSEMRPLEYQAAKILQDAATGWRG